MVVKNQQVLGDLYANIVMIVKQLTTITRPICRYCIFLMALWKL